MYAPAEHCSITTMHTGVCAAATFLALRTTVNEVQLKHTSSLNRSNKTLSGVFLAHSKQKIAKRHIGAMPCLSVCLCGTTQEPLSGYS